MTTHALIERLEQKRHAVGHAERELAKAEQRLAILRAELSAFEEAVNLVGAGQSGPAKGPRAPRAARTGRRMSEGWAHVLQRMLDRDDECTLAEIEGFAHAAGMSVTPENVRSQMSVYTKHGLVRRTRPGHFRALAHIRELVSDAVRDYPAPDRAEDAAQSFEGTAGA